MKSFLLQQRRKFILCDQYRKLFIVRDSITSPNLFTSIGNTGHKDLHTLLYVSLFLNTLLF